MVVLGAGTAAAMAVREEVTEESLIASVRAGGVVVYLRHAERFKGTHDTLQPTSSWSDFADCAQQRNLTPAGRVQAKELGDDLRLSGVRVDRIVALPLCRTRDTAILAFGNTLLDRRMYDPAFVAGQLAVPPKPGTVTALVGSEFQLRQIAGFELNPAEMAVFRPDGKGGTALLGRLKLEDWLDD
ncbi:MAG TPA: hypothetical protein VG742_14410 [Dongiaceae bacterium]|nr:hypothetical protein [Dongiaceae bacterium]